MHFEMSILWYELKILRFGLCAMQYPFTKAYFGQMSLKIWLIETEVISFDVKFKNYLGHHIHFPVKTFNKMPQIKWFSVIHWNRMEKKHKFRSKVNEKCKVTFICSSKTFMENFLAFNQTFICKLTQQLVMKCLDIMHFGTKTQIRSTVGQQCNAMHCNGFQLKNQYVNATNKRARCSNLYRSKRRKKETGREKN